MPLSASILRRQCLRILTGSTLAITTGTVYTNGTCDAFQINVLQEPDATSGTPDWPSFLGRHRDGISAETIEKRDWSQLPLRWQYPLGDGYAMGSLAEGRFLMPHLLADQETLDCLDASTGKSLWRKQRKSEYSDLYNYDSGPRCSPVIENGRVFQFGVDGVMTARNLSDGKLLWSRDLNQDYQVIQNFFGVGSTPITYQNLLITMVGGSPEEDANVPPGALERVHPNGSAIVAVDQATGKTVYAMGDDLASYSSPVITTIGKSDVGLAFCRQGLLAFDPATGKQHFHFPHRSSKRESVNAATPIVQGGRVLLSETYGVGSVLLEIQPDNLQPKVIWQDDPESRERSLEAHWNTPVLHQGYLYASSGRHTGNAELRCVRWSDGKVMWSRPGLGRCSLTLVGKNAKRVAESTDNDATARENATSELVVQGERGELFLIDATPQAFRPITVHQFPPEHPAMKYPAWAAPIVAAGSLWTRDAHQLYCFQISDS